MEIIEIPEEHVLVDLSSTEVLALWRAFDRASREMDKRECLDTFEMTPEIARRLTHKLTDAIEIARSNVRDE